MPGELWRHVLLPRFSSMNTDSTQWAPCVCSCNIKLDNGRPFWKAVNSLPARLVSRLAAPPGLQRTLKASCEAPSLRRQAPSLLSTEDRAHCLTPALMLTCAEG